MEHMLASFVHNHLTSNLKLGCFINHLSLPDKPQAAKFRLEVVSEKMPRITFNFEEFRGGLKMSSSGKMTSQML